MRKYGVEHLPAIVFQPTDTRGGRPREYVYPISGEGRHLEERILAFVSSMEADRFDAHRLDSYVFNKLISIYVAVIEAAALADDWILVDRSREDHSPTAELLLELALEKTNARPSILCIDCVERFLDREHCQSTAQSLLVLEALQQIANPEGGGNKNAEQLVQQQSELRSVLHQLYSPGYFMKSKLLSWGKEYSKFIFASASLRSEVNSELNFPPNFEGLVLGCIEAKFCK